MVRRPTRFASERSVGLARALSKLGYCSRSQARDLIRTGRVRLNGSARRDPETPVRMGKDRIEVDGKAIAGVAKIYIMLNKPRGLVTTAQDEQGRDTIYSCLKKDLPWLAPVGRLDKASEGLLLLTNDSEWAARIALPANHVPKTYQVQIAGVKSADFAEAIANGIRVPEFGLMCAKSARILRHGERNTWIEVILDEGKNRQIRRMLDALGAEVLRLIRVAIGPLELGDLPKGAYRGLSAKEKSSLDSRRSDRI